MVDFFLYDNSTGAITLNEYEILLVKEFATLYDTSRNKCKKDPTGINRLRAWREFKYIFIMLDFKSPYLEYIEQERHEQAMKDSELTDKEWEDPDFRAACRKYMEIKDSSRILSLIKTAFRTLEKMRVFLDNIEFTDMDGNGKYLNDPKKVLESIGQIKKMNDYLRELENDYKKDQESTNTRYRGDVEIGLDD